MLFLIKSLMLYKGESQICKGGVYKLVRRKKKGVLLALSLLTAFVFWTALVGVVDVKPIGPQNSKVGFATLNAFFCNVIGTNMFLYILTDWLGLVPIAVAVGFGILGLLQWMKRKSIRKVDGDILALGLFYIVVIFVYILFEYVVINCRPVLIEGCLEASYPSSTTMLVATVMPTAAMQMHKRIKNGTIRRVVVLAVNIFTAFMVICRLLSGVHWLSDIIGGLLFSAGGVCLYRQVLFLWKRK